MATRLRLVSLSNPYFTGTKSLPECCPSSRKHSKAVKSISMWSACLQRYTANVETEQKGARSFARVIAGGRTIAPGMPSAILRITAIEPWIFDHWAEQDTTTASFHSGDDVAR